MAAAEGSTSTVVNVDAADPESRGTAAPAVPPPLQPPPPAPATAKATAARPFVRFMSTTRAKGGWKRGVFCFDLLIRIIALAATLTAAILMGTADETLSFFTELFHFHAEFDDFAAFTFFVIANAVAAGYLLISLPCSILTIVRPRSAGPRLLLIILDTVSSSRRRRKRPICRCSLLQLPGFQVMAALTTAAAASAAAIVYLAHKGNERANWPAFCEQFGDFCERTSGAVVASFVAAVLFMLMVLLSALALRKH